MNRYVVADLHGQLDLLNQIGEYIGTNDILYILGDSGDRGPHPWKTLKASLDDPRFIYLMGNHDLLLIKAIEQYNKIPEEDKISRLHLYIYGTGAIPLLAANGGMDTLNGWIEEPNRMEYYQRLRMLPLEIRLAALDGEHFIYLTHAGYSPRWYNPDNVDNMVWDREHFYDEPDEGSLLIHGHTPIQVLTRRLKSKGLSFDCSKGYCLYSNGSKVCIDTGACSTGEAVLVNIDTLESKTFSIKEDIDGAEKN